MTTPRPGVTVFVLNGATWRELRSPHLPNISRFLESAAVGLMNTKGPQDRDAASVWVTLGAGRGAAAGVKEMPLEIGDRNLSPISPLITPTPALPHPGGGESATLLPLSARVANFRRIMTANRRAYTQAQPGLLGETLFRHGVGRTLIRDSAGPDMSPALVSDAEGRISTFHDIPGRHGLIDLAGPHNGDLVVRSFYLPQDPLPGAYLDLISEDAGAARSKALVQADGMFGEVLRDSFSDTLVILLSPSCPQFTNPHSRALAPIAIRGPGFSELAHNSQLTTHNSPALLVSSSTRRTGLVANVDFAPTVLHFFDIPVPLEMTGRPLRRIPSPSSLETLDASDRQAAVTYRLREEFTPRFLAIAGGLILLLAAAVLFAPQVAARFHSVLSAVLLSLTASPLAVFLLSAFPISRAWDYVAATLALAAAIAVVSGRLRRSFRCAYGAFPDAFGLICLATAAAIWADLLAGSPLLRRSIIGYDPIIGSRFYGLGNAEAGLFISALLLAAGVLSDSVSRRRAGLLLWPLLGLGVLCIGASCAGANWGQGLSAAVAALAFWILLSSPAGRRKRVVAAVALVVLTAVIFVALDLSLQKARQSHLAYSVRLTAAEGTPAFLTLAARKLTMAGRLFTYNLLLPLGLPVLAALIILPLRASPRLSPVAREHRAFACALSACGIGGVASSLLNDSGIVAGISLACLPLLGLIYMAVEAARADFGN